MAPWTGGWDVPRALLVGLAAATLVALVVAASTSAAAFGAYNPAWDGAADLQGVARDVGVESTVVRDVAAYDEADAGGTVAVVLAPAEPYDAAEARALRRFVERGGTLVVADDFGPHANPLLDRLGADARIDGTPLRDEREHHRSPALPVATNVSAHPLTAGVDEVTLNHPSAVAPNGATVLVATSGYAYADADRDGALDDAERLDTYPVVTAESVGDGTLVVAGDPSLFINVMLERPGNRAFVGNLFAGADRVLLDYSHAGGFPPLSLAVLVLRESAWLQALAGALGLGALAAWRRGDLARLPLGRSTVAAERRPPGATEAELLEHLRRTHPDWDDERARRVVGGLMSSRGQSRGDD